MPQPDFITKPMDQMTDSEWESLCDGCGLCCQIRIEDEDTGEMALSNISCEYLCHKSNQCSDYANRKQNVADCVKITPKNVHELTWLPSTCGYRLIAFGEDLPDWHHLVCGDRMRVHTEGPSMKGGLISEKEVDWDEYEISSE